MTHRSRIHTALLVFPALLLSATFCRAGLIAPLSSDGSPTFSLDAPVFFQGNDLHRADILVSVKHSDLELAKHGGRGRVRLQLKLARAGVVAVDSSQVYLVHADDAESRLGFSVFEMSVRLAPGRWALTATLRDLGVEESLLAHDDEGSVVQGVLDIPRWEGRAPQLSDPEFRIAAGEHGRLLPHPERLYGVVQDTLEAYLELRGAQAGHVYVVDVEVFDPIHGGMDSEKLELIPDKSTAAALYRLPLGTFPAGSYRLRLSPQWAPEMSSESEFGVSWSLNQFLADNRNVELEGQLIFSGDRWNEFQALTKAGRLRALQDFWTELDPTPDTAANELYERFLGRAAAAERRFGAFGVHGALTDRGRIYVQHGVPADLQVQVVPLNGDDLDDTIGKVHDSYRLDRSGVTIKQATSLPHLELSDRDSKRNQRRVGREGAFELWSYTLDGDPLFNRGTVGAENLDLRFLFVDRDGTGHYRLEYSNTLADP
jgi:GWxTD domain-containing protein